MKRNDLMVARETIADKFPPAEPVKTSSKTEKKDSKSKAANRKLFFCVCIYFYKKFLFAAPGLSFFFGKQSGADDSDANDSSTSSNLATFQRRIQADFDAYQKLPAANLDQCPLKWWWTGDGSRSFECMRTAGRQVACVSATVGLNVHLPLQEQIQFYTKRMMLVSKQGFVNASMATLWLHHNRIF